MSLIDDFSKYQSLRGFSTRTIDRRRWSLSLLERFLAPTPIQDATSDLVEEFLLRWRSPQSRYSVRSDIRQFFRWANRRGITDLNPTDRIEPPRVPTRAATPLRPADLQRAFTLATGDLKVIIGLCAYAGLRVSEVARLRGRDIDVGEKRLVVRSGKGGKSSVVPLAPVLVQLLADAPSGELFPELNGQRISGRIKKHFVKLGIDARPHDLRHSFGTAAAKQARGNVVLVAQLMRHSSIGTTMRYVRWVPEGGDVVDHLYDPPDAA